MPSRDTLQGIARERLYLLFDEAQEQFDTHPERSHRYMEIAREIAMKVNISFPTALRRRMCRNCGHYLAYGENSRVRLNPGEKVKQITCEDCGNTMHIPYNDSENGEPDPEQEPGQ